MPFTLPRDKIKDMVEIVYNRNCVYQTAYHVIWCPKYRKRILKGEIAEALRLAITAICIEREWPILTLEIQPDHIHLFVTIPPSRERQKFCVHGIIGARQTGASNEHEHQTQFS